VLGLPEPARADHHDSAMPHVIFSAPGRLRPFHVVDQALVTILRPAAGIRFDENRLPVPCHCTLDEIRAQHGTVGFKQRTGISRSGFHILSKAPPFNGQGSQRDVQKFSNMPWPLIVAS